MQAKTVTQGGRARSGLRKVMSSRTARKTMNFGRKILLYFVESRFAIYMKMVCKALYNGTESIGYVILLLLITFYLFAVTGVMVLRDNNPWSFRSIEITMMTLLQLTTFDGWGDIFFTSYFGCDVYDGSGVLTTDPSQDQHALGGVMYCSKPEAQPLLATIYFLSFFFATSFSILSSVIGTIGGAIEDVSAEMRIELAEKKKGEQKESIASTIEYLTTETRLSRIDAQSLFLIKRALTGQNPFTKIDAFVHEAEEGTLWMRWVRFSGKIHLICKSKSFVNFMTFVICFTGAIVAAGTDKKADQVAINEITNVIQVIFTVECALRMIEEPYPWQYFSDPWNQMDFAVVVLSYLPLSSAGNFILMLRMLKLLRVLKILRGFPELQLIIETLTNSVGSLMTLGFLLAAFLAISGSIAVPLFGVNDPFNYGTVYRAMLTNFQVVTFDGWAGILFTEMYGCQNYGNGSLNPAYFEKICDSSVSKPQFVKAIVYFLFVVFVGAFVLITMFIGILTSHLEELEQQRFAAYETKRKVLEVKRKHRLKNKHVVQFNIIFERLDFGKAKTVGPDELKFGFGLVGMSLNKKEFKELWERIDKDGSGSLDFAEFLDVLVELKSFLAHYSKVKGKELDPTRVRTDEQASLLLPKNTLVAHVSEANFFMGEDETKQQIDKSPGDYPEIAWPRKLSTGPYELSESETVSAMRYFFTGTTPGYLSFPRSKSSEDMMALSSSSTSPPLSSSLPPSSSSSSSEAAAAAAVVPVELQRSAKVREADECQKERWI